MREGNGVRLAWVVDCDVAVKVLGDEDDAASVLAPAIGGAP